MVAYLQVRQVVLLVLPHRLDMCINIMLLELIKVVNLNKFKDLQFYNKAHNIICIVVPKVKCKLEKLLKLQIYHRYFLHQLQLSFYDDLEKFESILLVIIILRIFQSYQCIHVFFYDILFYYFVLCFISVNTYYFY